MAFSDRRLKDVTGMALDLDRRSLPGPVDTRDTLALYRNWRGAEILGCM